MLAGLASIATLPLAVYLTRFSDTYDLLHAGFAIPVAAGLALVVALRSRGARACAAPVSRPSGAPGDWRASAACSACSGSASQPRRSSRLGVYGLLEYVGSRD